MGGEENTPGRQPLTSDLRFKETPTGPDGG